MDLYNSCAYLSDVDPTFRRADEGEIETLLRASLDDVEGVFRLQVIEDVDGIEPIGYFHLSHARPNPDTVWISMFVLGAGCHGRGFGSEVARGLIGELGRLEWCDEVWLKVYLGNVAALRHWAGVGFREIREVRVGSDAGAADAPCVVLACRNSG
jgi:RimJ/RimL family protein N-acetyltransferase